jgi:hypothetical protein
MANKNDLFDFDEITALNNDNIQGANIAENCAPSGINNAIRGLASIVKRAIGSQGSAIASAATTAIGAPGTALYTTIRNAPHHRVRRHSDTNAQRHLPDPAGRGEHNDRSG